MTDDRRRTEGDGHRERDDRPAGLIGTVLGATLGPFGAAVGGVVDANRFAVKLSVGTGADEDTGDDATTIEIEDTGPNDAREADADETADADGTDGTASTEDPDESGG